MADLDKIRARISVADLVTESGVELRQGKGLCPFHLERTPSFTVFSDSQRYKCFGCGRSGGVFDFVMETFGMSFPEAVEYLADDAQAGIIGRTPATRTQVRRPEFTAEDARRTWSSALARLRDDDAVENDRPVYDYMIDRGLGEVWSESLCGILHVGANLPESVGWWPRKGYRIVVPLFAVHTAELVCVQSRCITESSRKTLFPTSPVRGPKVFANPPGVDMLRCGDGSIAVLVEGLTDFLAVATATPGLAVLGGPGAGSFRGVVGEWVSGKSLIIATDADDPGRKARDELTLDATSHGAGWCWHLDWGDAVDAAELAKRDGLGAVADILKEAVA